MHMQQCAVSLPGCDGNANERTSEPTNERFGNSLLRPVWLWCTMLIVASMMMMMMMMKERSAAVVKMLSVENHRQK